MILLIRKTSQNHINNKLNTFNNLLGIIDNFFFLFSPLTLLTDTKPPKKLLSVSVAVLSKA